jgi:signal transduction histidine kinase
VNSQAFTLITMTALVAGLIAVLVFAALRFAAAARDSRRHLHASAGETALLSQALEDAIGLLKSQERAMAARAEASERLSGQIVASLTAGLIVTDLDGRVRIVNPSSRRLLGLGDASFEGRVHDLLGSASPLTTVIDECLREHQPIVRRAVGELTAGLAHEFRNGLATIHGYARLLNLSAMTEPDRKYVEGLRAETEALGQVVTNFLNFARPTQLALAPVDVGQIAQRVAEELQQEAAAHGGQVTVSGTWSVVDGDEVLLRQALNNLARNGLEASVEAGLPPLIRIEGAVDAAARLLRVQVIDQGPGIEPAVRDRIFRPFFTTRRTGTGLGLALVQKIVVTHNGRIHAAPGPAGRGTAMQVALPLPEVLPKVAL